MDIYLTVAEATRIATLAIEGKVTRQGSDPPEVTREGPRVVVTFPRNDPQGTLAPDYDARVTLDAASGEILSILGPS